MKGPNAKEIQDKVVKRASGLRYALNGIRLFVLDGYTSLLHLLGATLVIVFAFVLKVSTVEWMFLIGAMGATITAEMINTAIEELCDHVTSEQHIRIKKIKDMSSAAVLVTALASALVGVLIFVPKII